MQSTGLEVFRDKRTTYGRHYTVGIGRTCVFLRQLRDLERRAAVWIGGSRIQINLARPDQLRCEIESKATKQTKPHRGQKSNKELTLTVVHPTARSW